MPKIEKGTIIIIIFVIIGTIFSIFYYYGKMSSPSIRTFNIPIRSDPIVGKWYAPHPDDLTFEFFSVGTFTEKSPRFDTYKGTWEKHGAHLRHTSLMGGVLKNLKHFFSQMTN